MISCGGRRPRSRDDAGRSYSRGTNPICRTIAWYRGFDWRGSKGGFTLRNHAPPSLAPFSSQSIARSSSRRLRPCDAVRTGGVGVVDAKQVTKLRREPPPSPAHADSSRSHVTTHPRRGRQVIVARPFAEPLSSSRRSSSGGSRTWVTVTQSSFFDELVEELFAPFDDRWLGPPRRW